MPTITLKGGPAEGKTVHVSKDTQTLRVPTQLGEYVYTPSADPLVWQSVDQVVPPAEVGEGLRRVDMRDDDVLLVEVPSLLSNEQVMRLAEQLKAAFGGNRRIHVLDGGAKLSAINTIRRPLSEDEINAMAQKEGLTEFRAPAWYVEVVRAVEKAHDIL